MWIILYLDLERNHKVEESAKEVKVCASDGARGCPGKTSHVGHAILCREVLPFQWVPRSLALSCCCKQTQLSAQSLLDRPGVCLLQTLGVALISSLISKETWQEVDDTVHVQCIMSINSTFIITAYLKND